MEEEPPLKEQEGTWMVTGCLVWMNGGQARICGAQLLNSSQHFLFHFPAVPSQVMTSRSKVQNPMTKYKLQELLLLIKVAECLMTPGFLVCVLGCVKGTAIHGMS